ncbi:unnamed protein product [Ilex paraguariensis]|uniref:SWIB domain-containing protein n=1 Tax=Ilex paraguariensis TaxID=185542 RepID=A0ABC8R4I2_9AQUA
MASTRVFGRSCRTLMAAAKSSAATASAPKAGGPSGILKPVTVSPALGKFLGVPEVSRSDAVKKVWEYIKTRNLQEEFGVVSLGYMSICSIRYSKLVLLPFFQNPANKKEIFCDEKLKTIFNGKDCVGFLEVARLLSQHFQKAG